MRHVALDNEGAVALIGELLAEGEGDVVGGGKVARADHGDEAMALEGAVHDGGRNTFERQQRDGGGRIVGLLWGRFRRRQVGRDVIDGERAWRWAPGARRGLGEA